MSQRVFENDFQILVGTYPHGTDPSLNNPALAVPAQLRTAITAGNAFITGSEAVVGAVQGTFAPQTGTITVADNDFTTGVCTFVLGPFEITVELQLQSGALAANTATNIATVIDRLPGFSASAVGAVVSVEYASDVSADVPFSVHHSGTKVNLVLSPATGVLAHGSPGIGAPIIT